MEGQLITYTYSPLDESKRQIRLLHLLPAAKGGNSAHDGQVNLTGTVTNHVFEIYCTFSVVSLDDHVEYEALSYVWGDTDNQQNICLDGHPFKITKNLHAALFHMRKAGERILWVDALCINQADMDERASQVLQMSSLYAQACTVVVYLGEWENSATAFRLIEGVGHDPDQHHFDAISMQEVLHSFGVELSPQTASAYLCEFFSLPWWSRLWTVQEYALAQCVVFQSGHDVLHGKSLENLNRSLSIHGSCCVRVNLNTGSWLKLWDPGLTSHLNDCQIITRVRDTLSMASRCGLRTILRLRARRCSNPLDKIYGMLALTPKRFGRAVKPNYKLAPSDLYTNATIAWIQLSRNLYIISSVDRITFPNPDLPSYVPDFNAEITDPYKQMWFDLRLETLALYNASKNEIEVTTALPSLQLLTKAIFVDTIIETETHPERIDEILFAGSASPESVRRRYTTPSKTIWKTLCGGVIVHYEAITNEAKFRLVTDSDCLADWGGRSPTHSEQRNDDRDIVTFPQTVAIVKLGRRLAITTSGYLGLIPEAAEPGDHVVIMPGGRVPYIIRQLEGAYEHHTSDGVSTFTERYEFIGDCYIHGIMFGEAWDETKLRPIVLA